MAIEPIAQMSDTTVNNRTRASTVDLLSVATRIREFVTGSRALAESAYADHTHEL
ncbi:MAG: hypothetical protein ACOC9Y_08460 [Chloroflexota bacterium]